MPAAAGETLPRMRASSPKLHLLAAGEQDYLFDVEGGRIRLLLPAVAGAICAALDAGDSKRAELVAAGLGLLSRTRPSQRLESQSIPASMTVLRRRISNLKFQMT